MIIELFGLPGSGKTTIAEEMKKKGALLPPPLSPARLVVDAGIFWCKHPLLALRLCMSVMCAPRAVRYTIFINGCLGYAARYRRALVLSRKGKMVILDQGFFQLFLSLPSLQDSFLKSFPRPDLLVAVETPVPIREERMMVRGWAARAELGTTDRLAWQQRTEKVFHSILPSIEKLMNVYRYDGAQDLQKGTEFLAAYAATRISTPAQESFVRQVCKIIAAGIASLLAQIVRIFNRPPQVIVLMYHAIDRSGWKLAVAPEVFERQMRYLAKKRWAVPLRDVVSYAKGEEKLSAHVVAVSFDDGYRDLLMAVLPILERYRIPATVFIPSDFSAKTDPQGRERLTEDDVRELARSPLITIGSHAKTHRKFTELLPKEMQQEAAESADALARVAGDRPHFFAYPFGARSANAERAVADAGYEAAFGITEGMVRKGDALFSLKRVQIDGTMSFPLFRLRLTSAVDLNRWIVDSFRSWIPV